jgi:hypothetical protein
MNADPIYMIIVSYIAEFSDHIWPGSQQKRLSVLSGQDLQVPYSKCDSSRKVVLVLTVVER